jgi:CheY-like chemotaxis protein
MGIRGDAERIYIHVKDAGRGFDHAAVRSRQGKGGGFGLYNIQDRIEFLGGDMRIETSPGRGCAVMLTVPICIPREDRSSPDIPRKRVRAQAGRPDPPESAPRADDEGGVIRILLADDHLLMREALAKMIGESKGLAVVGQAIDGKEAVEMTDRLKPHVILMDVAMPRLDGLEATAVITRDHPEICIIGLSMHNDVDTRQRMLEVGASVYLTKTGSPDALIETIRRVYAESRSTTPRQTKTSAKD